MDSLYSQLRQTIWKDRAILSDSKNVGATAGRASDDVQSAAVRGIKDIEGVAIAPVMDGEVQEAELVRLPR